MRLVAFLLIVWLMPALAVNTIESEFICPIDGTHWKQATETSSNVKVMRLDRREIGDVNDPRTLPQCPKCRFVMFIADWKDLAPLAERLRPFIVGAEYQMIAAKRPTYFCLAQIQEFLKAPPLFIGQSYLRAAWQVEENETFAQRYLGLALAQLSTATASMEPSNKDYANTLLLCGELERRLGKWDAAEKRFNELRDNDLFREPNHQTVIALQLRLTAARDSKPHLLEGNAIPRKKEPSLSLSGGVSNAASASTEDSSQLPDPKPVSVQPAPKPKPKPKLLGSP